MTCRWEDKERHISRNKTRTNREKDRKERKANKI